MESTDLLDPNFQQDAAAGADVVSQPMTASQAGYVEPKDTELPSVDTSSGSVKVKLPKDKKYVKYLKFQILKNNHLKI